MWKEIEETQSLEQLTNGSLIERFGPYEHLLEDIEDDCFFYGEIEADSKFWRYEANEEQQPLACFEYVFGKLTGDQNIEPPLIVIPEDGIFTMEAFQQMFVDNQCIVEEQYDASMEDLMEMLSSGECVVCHVSSLMLDYPEVLPHSLQTGDHIVVVTSLDLSKPSDIQVTLNRFDSADGFGKNYSWNTFLEAWKASGRFCFTVGRR